MASPKFNSKSPTIKRILKEASELAHSPSPDYHASPASDTDLFDWHFTIRGPPSTPYALGIYHGRIVLPPTYPLRPPSFRFLTPSGRFEVNREICLSISGHHEETWQPAWGIRTALVALRAFMESDAKGQLGGVESSKKDRERLAGGSKAWKCGVCGKSNEEIIEESAEAARALEGDKREEVEVPKELSLGYKDQLGEGKKNAEMIKDEGEDAELAEGFVRTGPVLPADSQGANSAPGPASNFNTNSYPAARPAQSAPLPTATIPQSQIQTAQVTAPARIANAYPMHQQQQVQRRSNDGVPLWIDRSIALVVLCLFVMILKILIGF